MNISKTLFKTLTRCSNAPALYNMYINKNFHDVKEIKGTFNNLDSHLNEIDDNYFNDEFQKLEDNIFSNMFDEETGEDLTIMTSAQLEAFKDIFSDIEQLAAKYISSLFNEKVISSKNTYEQKKFEYTSNGNKYYSYLDIYIEKDNKIKVFEVKSTTSRKFNEMHFIFKKGGTKFDAFTENKKIMEFRGLEYVGKAVDGKLISESDVLGKIKKVFNRYSDIGKYIYDISIERHIIESHFKALGENVPEVEYYLVVLNNKYIYDGKRENDIPIYDTDKNGEDLFKIYRVDYFTQIYQDIITKEKSQLEKEFEHLTICNNCLGEHCLYKKTEQCKFFNICHEPVLKDGSLLEYTGKSYAFKEIDDKGKNKTISMYDLINRGIYSMEEAHQFTHSIDHDIELDCYLNNKQYYDLDNLKFLIEKIKYPIYHLDFESYNSPLPRFYNERPYTQSLFQYSLHIEKEPGLCDIELDHLEYLAPDHLDRRRELAIKLINDIDLSKGGTVLAYHATFEKSRIKELMDTYPDLSDQLQVIYDSVFDLEHVIHASENVYQKYDSNYNLENKPKFNFYDKNLHASFSIKKILPIFTNLTYNSLEVKNGTEAVLVYGMLPLLTDKEYEEKYLALRKYCRQDTWSMVKILQGIKTAIKM